MTSIFSIFGAWSGNVRSTRTAKGSEIDLEPIRLAESNPVRGPVDEEDRADQLVARHRAPRTGVARLGAVVAHHEIAARFDLPDLPEVGAVRQAAVCRDVLLF